MNGECEAGVISNAFYTRSKGNNSGRNNASEMHWNGIRLKEKKRKYPLSGEEKSRNKVHKTNVTQCSTDPMK